MDLSSTLKPGMLSEPHHHRNSAFSQIRFEHAVTVWCSKDSYLLLFDLFIKPTVK